MRLTTVNSGPEFSGWDRHGETQSMILEIAGPSRWKIAGCQQTAPVTIQDDGSQNSMAGFRLDYPSKPTG
jgi:hypothetical protein